MIREYINILRALSKQKENKSSCRQILEILLMYARSRLGPSFYLKAQLYRYDASWRCILGFLSYKQYYRRVSQINDPLYCKSSQNKIIEKAIFTAYGQPTPKLLGHYQEHCGLAADGSQLRTQKDLEIMLGKQNIGDRICFKLTESWGGQGFRAFELRAENSFFDLASASVLSFDELMYELGDSEKTGMLVERYLDQHPSYSAYNKSSVNTVRVLVRQEKDGEVVCFGAFLRVGRSGSLVDNGDAGGIIYPIELRTGILQPGFSTKGFGEFFDSHPDTGVEMCGTVLPGFNDALELSKRVMHAFPGINFSGTDIAFSKHGPVVLEINVLPDYIDFAICRIPSREALA